MDLYYAKLLAQLLYPLGLVVWLSLGALLAQIRGKPGWARGLQLAALALLWLAATPRFSVWLRAPLEQRNPPLSVASTPTAEAILVLGGGMGTADPPRLTPDLNAAGDRILQAARLYQAGKAPLVVVSGGGSPLLGSGGPEAPAMAALLQEWGVPAKAIRLESRSLTTRENAVNSARLLARLGIHRVLLVTSALHMPRALASVRAVGVEAMPAPTDFEVTRVRSRTLLDWLPDAEALVGTTRAIKEYLGLLYYRYQGWV